MYKIGEAADQSKDYSQISKNVQVKVGRMKTGKARICENSEVTNSNTTYLQSTMCKRFPKGVQAEETKNLLD